MSGPDLEERACHWCGTEFPRPDSALTLGTGYGLDDEGHRYCYLCCGVQDALHMQRGERMCLYLTGSVVNGYEITNWPGSLRLKPTRVSKGKHNIARTRYDAWFMFQGTWWHGVQYGENTQLLHCKPLKG